MRGAAASGILAVRKRAAPRNRMREILTSGSVGGLVEQSPILPGRDVRFTHVASPWADIEPPLRGFRAATEFNCKIGNKSELQIRNPNQNRIVKSETDPNP
jgi:hypothetical protein